ncbi:hypothetical protein BDB13_6354 [Rhodococcus sp. OK302]|nr:hypothetical protein BDB13_6354 [Rhodococcus sp. OK302]
MSQLVEENLCEVAVFVGAAMMKGNDQCAFAPGGSRQRGHGRTGSESDTRKTILWSVTRTMSESNRRDRYCADRRIWQCAG